MSIQYAQLEVATQTGTDTVIGMRVDGGWTSWQTYWPDEMVISVTEVQIFTTSELTRLIGRVWREGRDHGAQYPHGKKGPSAHDEDNPYKECAECGGFSYCRVCTYIAPDRFEPS